MDWYFIGVLFALLLWLWGAIYLIVALHSQFERNLNKIGQRLSWVTLTPKAMDSDDENRPLWRAIGKYLLIVGFGFPWILLSWLNVGLAVAMMIYRRSKDAGAPQAIRELRWKMRNLDMPFDQVVKEMMKASGEEPEKFESVKADLLAEMESRGLDIRRSTY